MHITAKITFLLFMIFFIVAPHAFAAQYAIVNSAEAIIYSDTELTVPIGYVSKGKRIVVGEVARKHSTLLPVVVGGGKIAYIQIKDINLLKEVNVKKGPRVTEHDTDIVAQKIEDKLNENNHLLFTYNLYELGSQWNAISQRMDDNTNQSGYAIKVLLEHRPPQNRLSWGIGLGYFKHSQKYLAFEGVSAEITGFWSPINFRLFSIDLMAGVLGSPVFNVVDKMALQPTTRGSMYGSQFGAQVRVFPYSKYSLVSGASVQNLKLTGFDKTIVEQESTIQGVETQTMKLSKITGTNFYLGISYKF